MRGGAAPGRRSDVAAPRRRPSARLGRMVAASALVAAPLGCVYLNGLYNAGRAYEDAERARLAGLDSLAEAGYRRALAGARRSYDRDPGGRWSDDALYLLGRALFRAGDLAGAREALERARAASTERDVRLGATMYLGAIALEQGERGGIELVDSALAGLGRGAVRGEGHLLRARHLLGLGEAALGWAELERARLEDRALAVPAALEWLRSGVGARDEARATEAMAALLAEPEAALRADAIEALALRHWELGGSGARLLAGADAAAWRAPDRDRLILLRARLHLRSGDTAAARADGLRVTQSEGGLEREARMWLARLTLAGARRVRDLAPLEALLLPDAEDAASLALMEDVRRLELLSERGRRTDPLGLFAAAELARDRLGARSLAQALFVEYAGLRPPEPWRGKALLAAAAASPDGPTSARLRRAAAALTGDPYVAVADGMRGDPEAYENLERELRDRLTVLLARVTAAVEPPPAAASPGGLAPEPRR